jgi:hypothetical protein
MRIFVMRNCLAALLLLLVVEMARTAAPDSTPTQHFMFVSNLGKYGHAMDLEGRYELIVILRAT